MDKWIQGTITARLGDLHYEIVYNGKQFKRHVDQIRGYSENKKTEQRNNCHPVVPEEEKCFRPRYVHFYPETKLTSATHTPCSTPYTTPPESSQAKVLNPNRATTPEVTTGAQHNAATPRVMPRRSSRNRRPPQRYSSYKS